MLLQRPGRTHTLTLSPAFQTGASPLKCAWFHPPSLGSGGWESPLRLLGKREAPRCQTDSALRWPHRQGRMRGLGADSVWLQQEGGGTSPCWVHTPFAARTPDSRAPWKPQLSRRARRWERICFGAASQQLFVIESAASELTVKLTGNALRHSWRRPRCGKGREGTGSPSSLPAGPRDRAVPPLPRPGSSKPDLAGACLWPSPGGPAVFLLAVKRAPLVI